MKEAIANHEPTWGYCEIPRVYGFDEHQGAVGCLRIGKRECVWLAGMQCVTQCDSESNVAQERKRLRHGDVGVTGLVFLRPPQSGQSVNHRKVLLPVGWTQLDLFAWWPKERQLEFFMDE